MSRFSPGVLPHAYDPGYPDLAGALASAFAGDYERKRQAKIDDEARLGHDVSMYEHGVRTGAMPSDDMTITSIGWEALGGRRGAGSGGGWVAEGPPLHPGHTAMDEDPRDYGLDRPAFDPRLSAGALSGAFQAAGPAPTLQGSASTTGLASAFGDRAKSRALDGGDANAGDDMASRAPAAAVHPGAFDPATRQFGGAPSQQMTAVLHAQGAPGGAPAGPTSTTLRNTNPRYARLDDAHYIDTFHTPEAERDRDRQEQAQIAATYRQADIALRGQQATDLEGAKQRGRLELRDKINTELANDIRLRGSIAGENQAAHDARARGTAITVAGMRSGGAGARGSAASDANHRFAADGVIRAAGGDYKAAADWLNNTPEGQQAKQNGLLEHHLYEAQGRYFGHVTDQGVRLEAGASALNPGEAIGAVNETGAAVRGAARPGSSDAQITERRRDWDAAAASLRKQRKTQAEIVQILKGPRP